MINLILEIHHEYKETKATYFNYLFSTKKKNTYLNITNRGKEKQQLLKSETQEWLSFCLKEDSNNKLIIEIISDSFTVNKSMIHLIALYLIKNHQNNILKK